MKEEFDLSRYLNHSEKSDGSQILSELISKAVSTKQETEQAEPMKQSEGSQQSSASEQPLPSESLNEAKEAVKAEHSEQEKQQAVSSSPRRITTREPGELSGSLSHTPQNHRPKGNLSQSLHVGTLGVCCPSLGRLRSECFKFLGEHSPPTFGRIQRGYRTLAQTLITAFRAISNEMNNRHSQKTRRTRDESES